MSRSLRGVFLASLVCLTCGFPAVSEAATISSLGSSSLPGFSTGSIGPVGATPAANNDNTAAASPNSVPYSIFLNAGGAGTLEVEFVLTASGGTTEYRFPQNFVNNTGLVLSGFVFELGFGTGANFVLSTALDELDFDTPDQDPAPQSGAFPGLVHGVDTLVWSGGAVPSIGVFGFAFAVDTPDNLQTYHPGGLNRFTLRQTAIAAPVVIPEPGTYALALVGLAAMAERVRRTRP